jgi:hypothetical protein
MSGKRRVSAPRLNWSVGAPPGAGQWWIVWKDDRVYPVEISPAVLRPDGHLLLKFGNGQAFLYEDDNRGMIKHHAALIVPAGPTQ